MTAGPGPGEVKVEIVRPNYEQLPGFAFSDADPMTESSLAHTVSWNGSSDVSSLAGRSVKLRFDFKNAMLYPFQSK